MIYGRLGLYRTAMKTGLKKPAVYCAESYLINKNKITNDLHHTY